MASIHETVAARANAGGLPLTAAAVAEIDRMLADERAGEREAGGLGCVSKVIGVHEEGYAIFECAGSCGKADDISGEARA